MIRQTCQTTHCKMASHFSRESSVVKITTLQRTFMLLWVFSEMVDDQRCVIIFLKRSHVQYWWGMSGTHMDSNSTWYIHIVHIHPMLPGLLRFWNDTASTDSGRRFWFLSPGDFQLWSPKWEASFCHQGCHGIPHGLIHKMADMIEMIIHVSSSIKSFSISLTRLLVGCTFHIYI